MWSVSPADVRSPVHLLLVNVPPLLQSSLQATIKLYPDFIIGNDSGNSPTALYTSGAEIQIALLAITSETDEYVAMIKELWIRWPSLGVVVISALPSTQQLLAVVQAGVRGYVTWSVSSTSLIAVLQVVAQGGYACCHQSVELLETYVGVLSEASVDMSVLSAREKEITAHIAAGESNIQIALVLGISVKTVEFHITRIFRKTGLQSRVHVATAWLRQPGSTNTTL